MEQFWLNVVSFTVATGLVRVFRNTLRLPGLLAVSAGLSLALTLSGSTNANDLSLSSVLVYAIYGFLLGLPLALISEIGPMAFGLADTVRGVHFASQYSPGSNQGSAGFSAVVPALSCLLFFSTPFCTWQFRFWLQSLAKLNPQTFSFASAEYFAQLIQLAQQSLELSLITVWPVVMVILIIDTASGILGRLLARFNPTFELLPIKLVLGLLLVLWLPNFTEVEVLAKILAQVESCQSLVTGGG